LPGCETRNGAVNCLRDPELLGARELCGIAEGLLSC
jgi:hypothetical protein